MTERHVHLPVLLEETLQWLRPASGGLYVDATLGLGGHSRAILEASAPDGRVIGFEWDRQAAAEAGERLAEFGERFRIVRASYTRMAEELARLGVPAADGLIADLGVSSLQLDEPERGFAFQHDAPLDMRMDRDRPLDAARILAEASESQLADLLYHFGEERQARRIARHLVRAREAAPITGTGQLAELVARAIPRKYHPKQGHVATRTFQALRMAVNRELYELKEFLAQIGAWLKPGGRLAIISFHSLEDRIVKQAFKTGSAVCVCPKSLPECICGVSPIYRVLTKRPIVPSAEEVAANPRSGSAKLRAVEKI